MLKKLKQEIKQKKQTWSSNVQSWKGNFKKDYDQRFPLPQLDKSTNHLIEENQELAVSQSVKTTKQILKFRLI